MDLRAQRAEKLKEARAIIEEAGGPENLTDEQLDQVEALNASADDLEKQIEAQQRRQSAAAAVQARSKAPEARRTVEPASVTPSVTDVREGWLDDPKKGFSSHKAFLLDVMADARGRGSKHLQQYKATVGSDEHSTVSQEYGGILTPKAFSPNLAEVSVEADPMAGKVTPLPMEAPIVTIAARVDKDHSTSVSGGLRVYRRAETESVTPSRTKLEGIEFKAEALFGVSYVTEELLSRSLISFISLLEAGFRTEFTGRLVNERLNGSGVGEFLGVMNSPCLITVAKETGQAADSLVYENVLNMLARWWTNGGGKGMWLASRTLIPQLGQLSILVGTSGVPVWQPSAREGIPGLLMGIPLVFSEYMEAAGDLGDILLGDWSQYLEGTYSPMASAESMHVRFENHERSFKFWMENCGAPWWRSALTPKKGVTLSPFVTLAARA